MTAARTSAREVTLQCPFRPSSGRKTYLGDPFRRYDHRIGHMLDTGHRCCDNGVRIDPDSGRLSTPHSAQIATTVCALVRLAGSGGRHLRLHRTDLHGIQAIARSRSASCGPASTTGPAARRGPQRLPTPGVVRQLNAGGYAGHLSVDAPGKC